MDGVRQYILSVVCIAILCGLIQLLMHGNSSTHSAIKFVIGLVLTVTVISPLMHIEDLRLDTYFDTISDSGQWAVAEGEEMTFQYLSKSIKEESESYILNKANQFGTQINVSVSLEEENLPTPKQITITGPVSPYVKKQLSQYIEQDLGIAEEDQIWIS